MDIREEVTRETIARNVRRAMFEADLTQAALAEQMTITRETLRHRLSGKKPFTTDELAQIAVATGVPFSELVKVTEKAIAA
ncbi:helix-turn-helix domain-containing protein [Rothia sp. L_38]|uniref:helix-turn-helix domain-containing protein n=1 Tax=Rothia sp. L_38 TaxID=3422315 RepID=UPI003D6A7D8E